MRWPFTRFIIFGLIFIVSFGVVVRATADDRGTAEIAPIEKIAVFPVQYAGERGLRVDEATAKGLDEAWWQVREEFTETGRFVVAARAFLQKTDAFQPRGVLSVGDAVILGRYVEADALVTMRLDNRTFAIEAYSSTDGGLLWRQSVELHPSVLIREQIAKVARAVTREFIASIPYQAVTLQDSLSKQPIFTENGKRFARLRLGRSKAEIGDAVEWIKVNRRYLDPLFQGGGAVTVRAEGLIREITDERAVVEITRAPELQFLREGTPANLPREQARLADRAKPKDSATSAAVVSLLAAGANGAAIQPEGKQIERAQDDRGAMATTLSILGSLAVILLLAF